MGRRKTVEQITKDLAYANARRAYYATDRPRPATVVAQPREQYGYRSVLLGTATASTIYLVQASQKAVTILGGVAALKLIGSADPDFATGIEPGRGFKPSKIHAVYGDPTPTVVTARTTSRKYIKYNRNSTGDQQSSYSSPVNGTGPLATSKEQLETVAAIATAIKTAITTYGRVWYEAEVYSGSLN